MEPISDTEKKNDTPKTIEEIFREDEEKCVGLTAEELKKLPDEDLMNALLTRGVYLRRADQQSPQNRTLIPL